MAAADPRGQSGSSSTPAEWESARRFIFAAIDRDGTFLDVGCANGQARADALLDAVCADGRGGSLLDPEVAQKYWSGSAVQRRSPHTMTN
jgi:hypothetical protein